MLSGCVELVESFEGVFVQRGMVVARVRSWGVRGVVKRRARLHVINIIYLTYMYIYSEWGGGPRRMSAHPRERPPGARRGRRVRVTSVVTSVAGVGRGPGRRGGSRDPRIAAP